MSMTQFTMTNGNIVEGNGYQPQAPVTNQPIFQDTAKMKYEITAEGGFKSLEGGQYMVENQLQGSILSTARNNGNPVISADGVNDNTIVKIGGMEMTAKSAASAGFLTKDSNGRYHEGKVNFQDRQDATGQAPADDPQQTANENNINYELVDRNLEQSLDSIGNTIGFNALDSVALSSVAGLVNGDINHAAKNLATSMGTEHNEAVEFIQEAYTRLEAKSVSYITRKHGVNGTEAVQWASEHIPSHERSSLLYRIYNGDSTALDLVATRYKGSQAYKSKSAK